MLIEVHMSIYNFCKEFFVELDEEEDGFIYMKQIVVTLKALNQDIDHNLKVNQMLLKYVIDYKM